MVISIYVFGRYLGKVKLRYLRGGSSDLLRVWFYGGVFGIGGSNAAISGLIKFNRYVGKTMREELLDWSQSKVFLVVYMKGQSFSVSYFRLILVFGSCSRK